ncbi:unnamed protein product [Ascophyllum nodosum]
MTTLRWGWGKTLVLRTQQRKMNRRRRWKAFPRKRCRGRADGLGPRVSLAVLDSAPDACLHLFRRILKLTQLTTMWSTYRTDVQVERTLYTVFFIVCTLPSCNITVTRRKGILPWCPLSCEHYCGCY